MNMKKQTKIQSRIVWMAVYPNGILAAQIYASSKRAVQRGLADTPRDWRELERAGWRAVRVKISPLRITG